MSRAEISRRKESAVTLNDDKLPGERKSPSEPSVAIMGKSNRRKSKAAQRAFSVP